MASNPQVALGTLNRLRGSIVFPNFPSLNITASFLGRAGISLSFEGEVTGMLPQMVGMVTSPMPYQSVTMTAALLKTTSLAALWEAQRQTLSTLGDAMVTTDTSTLPNYTFVNCALKDVAPLSFAGETADYVVTITGTYQINNNLWNLV